MIRASARLCALAAFACAAFAGAAQAQLRAEIVAQTLEGHGRLILDFPGRLDLPGYEIGRDNGVLSIRFDQPVAAQLPDIAALLPDYVAVARLDPDGTGLRMGLRGPVRIHPMEAGEQLFVDFLPAGWVGLPPGLPQEVVDLLAERAREATRLAEERRRAEMVAQYNPAASLRVGRHPTFTRIVFDWNVGTEAAFAQGEEGEGDILFNWPVPIDLYALRSALPPGLVSVANSVAPEGSRIAFALEETARMRFYEEAPTRFVLDIDHGAAPLGVEAASLLGPDSPAGAEPAVLAPGAPPAVPQAPAHDPIYPFTVRAGETVRLVFPFAEETAAAVFRRGDVVWMLFDTEAPIGAPGEDPDLALLAGDFRAVSTGGAQIVRMELTGRHLTTLGSEGRSWVLSLGEVLLDPTEPMTLERRRILDGRFEMVADLGRPGRVHQLRDPDVGDLLDVVTAFPPARGVMRDLDYVDFSVPASVHGLVVRPKRDRLDVTLDEGRAVISREAGLTLSPPRDRHPLLGPEADRSGGERMLADLAATPSAFERAREAFSRGIAQAEGKALDRGRLELARFYLANQFGPEALGVLAVLDASPRRAELEPEIRLARAGASLLAGRPAEALRALDAEALHGQAETLVWRAVARAEHGDFEGARLDALSAMETVSFYPGWLRNRFLLAGVEAAIERADAAMAARFMGAVELGTLSAGQGARLELLSGRLDEMNGRTEHALESYGRVIAADIRPATAEAVLRTVRLLEGMDRLDPGLAADVLAVHSTLWRGDRLEVEMSRLLADLHFRNGDYRAGFIMVRDLAASQPDSTALDALVDQAARAFAGLYLDGDADGLDAVEALSIYYDFRHLTPTGADGDAMIRNLAQRLVKVDLLVEAAALLAYQVDNRLSGAERARVGADLAMVHLVNRDPAAALGVIHRTRLAGLPPALERQRRILEGRALVDAGRGELALDLLSSLSGREVDFLRVDALWREARYGEAGEALEALYAPELERGALSPAARAHLLKAAVGYVLDGDRLGLSRLRAKAAPLLAETPEWPLFAFVTETVETEGREFRSMANRIAALDSLDAFLAAYRAAYTEALVPAG